MDGIFALFGPWRCLITSCCCFHCFSLAEIQHSGADWIVTADGWTAQAVCPRCGRDAQPISGSLLYKIAVVYNEGERPEAIKAIRWRKGLPCSCPACPLSEYTN
jgi:hypothetical protein